MVPTALANAVRYTSSGNMDLWIVGAIALGAVPSGYFLGADIAQKLPADTLRMMFALFMVVVAVRMMPSGSIKSMGALLGALLVSIGVRLVMAR